MTISTLIFDFDGLILDTETPEVDVWKKIFAEYGYDYSKENWHETIGGWGSLRSDPADALQRLHPELLDLGAIRTRQRRESDELILRNPIMKGVESYLKTGRRLGLRMAIASSSERGWVEPHLERLGLKDYFDPIICGDDVPPGRSKPFPDLFLKVLGQIRIKPNEAVVLEDSPNGVKAARAAGLFVVAVPNPVTALLPIEGADLLLDSLASLPLEELLKRVEAAMRPGDLRRSMAGTQPLS